MNDLFNEEGQSTPIEKGELVLSDVVVEETPQSVENTAETKVEEAKAETTEVKPETQETKVDGKKEAEKPTSLFDKFKKPESEAKVEGNNTSAIVDDKRVAELEEKLKRYDNPLAKLLGGDYDLTNVDITALVKSAAGEDYSGYSTEDLIAKSLNVDPDFQALTPDEQKEEIEARLDNLKTLSKYEVQKERSKILSTLNKGGDVNELVKGLEEVKANQLNAIKEPEKWYEEKVTSEFTEKFEATKTEIKNLATQLVGQDYNGFIVTEEIANQIAAEFEDQTLNFSTDKVAFNLFKIAAFDKAVEAAETRGYEKAMLEKANPSTNSSSAPVIVTRDSDALKTSTKEDFFSQANS